LQIAPFELELWMNKHELNVKYDIAESGIAPLSIKELLAYDDDKEAIDSITNLALGYNDANGAISLREAIAKTYSECTPENILITIGAIEANFLIFHLLLNKGDHVVVQFPAYQQLYSVPEAMGCNVAYWRCRDDNGFKFDLADLRKLIQPDTKLIVINTPHNPTGAVLSNSEMAEIYDLAEAVGAYVFSDEAYRWLHVPSSTYNFQPAFNLGSSAISTGTMSKPFGLPGLRIGWIAAQPHLIEKCRSTRHYISLCPGKVDDTLAAIAFRNKDKIFKRNEQMITENLFALKEWVDRRADILSYHYPAAGLLCMLRYHLDIPSVQLADKLAEQYSVLLAPGSVFGLEGYLRLGFGQRPDIFKKGIESADQCFSELIKSGIKTRAVRV
jgi:aspartate/methionine/tyrosine aminotransferase